DPVVCPDRVESRGRLLKKPDGSAAPLTAQTGAALTVDINSPLVVYGDTSQDGYFYSGKPFQPQNLGKFSNKPMPHDENLPVTLTTPPPQPTVTQPAQMGAKFTGINAVSALPDPFANITPPSASWITTGLLVDGLVPVDGVAVGTVYTLTANLLTLNNLTAAYLTFANGSHTVKEWNTGTITRTDGKSWSDSFFSVEGLITLGKPLAGLTFARGAAGDTISRASGDWATDGFIAGQLIYVSGTPGNNGVFTIAGVSANHKTLVLTAVNALNPEGPETA